VVETFLQSVDKRLIRKYGKKYLETSFGFFSDSFKNNDSTTELIESIVGLESCLTLFKARNNLTSIIADKMKVELEDFKKIL